MDIPPGTQYDRSKGPQARARSRPLGIALALGGLTRAKGANGPSFLFYMAHGRLGGVEF